MTQLVNRCGPCEKSDSKSSENDKVKQLAPLAS